MRPSFAHFSKTRHAGLVGLAAALALALAGCATLPPPTAELEAAQQALARATAADADQYAAAEIAQARAAYERAQAAMARGRDTEARADALAAATDADLAQVLSRAAVTRAELRQQQADVAELRARLQMAVQDPMQDPLDDPPPAAPPLQRLQALEADPRFNPFARYERLQARQAIDAALAASKRERVVVEQRAERRVGIAEQTARIEATRRAIETLERERSELRVEASRRDAERARAEAERLRMEAQVQAEEAARLRAQAEQAEAVLDTAQIDQDERVAAARAREAALARQEAELVAGASLPPSRKEAQGEVFTLAGDAFGSGQSQLTTAAAGKLQALGLYLKAMRADHVRVVGHTDSQGEAEANRALSQRRADAVQAALVEAGLRRAQVNVEGLGEDAPVADNASADGRARNRRVEILVEN